MKLTFTTRGITDRDVETLRKHLEHRLGLALDRHLDLVTSLSVVLDDVNGPRGGLDKRCRLVARGPSIGEVVLEEVAFQWSGAIDGAIATLAKAVARQHQRSRRFPRRRLARVNLQESA